MDLKDKVVKRHKSSLDYFWGYCWHDHVNPLSANPTKCQTHLNNSSATADELFECVWPYCGVDA